MLHCYKNVKYTNKINLPPPKKQPLKSNNKTESLNTKNKDS